MKKCEESRRKRHWPTVENEKTVKIAEEKGISLRRRMRKLQREPKKKALAYGGE